MSSFIITLTTDFGATDWYVSAIKGAVLGVSSYARIVDITHNVPSQDVGHAAFVLGNVFQNFPPETVHVAVVDPGVGTSRRAILLVTPHGKFVAPDNGLLTYVLLRYERMPEAGGAFMSLRTMPVPYTCEAYELTVPEYWNDIVSSTFHGRDIFAPVAAHLSLGVKPEFVGTRVEEMVSLNIESPIDQDGQVEGRIIFIDHFGNLVSNISASQLAGDVGEVELDGVVIGKLSRVYSDRSGLLALVGSHGYVEIAERDGNAATRLGVAVGESIRIARQI